MSARMAFPAGQWQEQQLPQYWCGGDAFETRFLEAMSLIAPEVERFLIRAVSGSLAQPGGEALAPQGMAFIREEAGHSRVHHGFNRRLVGQGIDLAAVLASVRGAEDFARRRLPAGGQIAVAAACEQLSVLLSLSYLRAARKSRILSPRVARLFEVHAREEIGHRALVFDLMKCTGGGGVAARALALVAVSAVGIVCALRVIDALLKHDTAGNRARLWLKGLLQLVRAGGWVSPRALLREWLAYLRPGFHPSQLPDS